MTQMSKDVVGLHYAESRLLSPSSHRDVLLLIPCSHATDRYRKMGKRNPSPLGNVPGAPIASRPHLR